MRKLILFASVALACADTLTLKNGSRIEGTMLSANDRTISFVENDGSRHDYEIDKIREIRFGRSPSDPIGRLNDRISETMEHTTFSARQRQMLDDARAVLIKAGDDLRANRKANGRDVRKALDNVRYVMNSSAVRLQDRRAVLDDIAEVREQHKDFRINR
jgi:hypothetical protein